MTGLEGRYDTSLARVDLERSNVLQTWSGEGDWPTEDEWAELRASDRLYEEALGEREAEAGELRFTVELPMPGIARLRLTPA